MLVSAWVLFAVAADVLDSGLSNYQRPFGSLVGAFGLGLVAGAVVQFVRRLQRFPFDWTAHSNRTLPAANSPSADCSAAASASAHVCHDSRAQGGRQPFSRTYSPRNVRVVASLG